MTSFRILHISDTHLSPRTSHFRHNNDVMAKLLADADHDLIIHTGDITLDGIRYEEDYTFCQEFFAGTGKDIMFLPGNHDIGDNPRLSEPAAAGGSAINAERIARYERFHGEHWWSTDIHGWRLIGINSLIVGSGEAREAEQYAWLREQLATAGSNHIALFTHQPLYVDEPDPIDLTYWTVDPDGRENMRFLMEDPRLRLIASGHLHQQRSRLFGAVKLEWCPSIAFTTREELVPEMGGRREVGFLEHELHADGSVTTRHVSPASFGNDYLDDCIKEVYPAMGPDT